MTRHPSLSALLADMRGPARVLVAVYRRGVKGFEQYIQSWGPGWTHRVQRLMLIDGHQVAWVTHHDTGRDVTFVGASLLCDCDLAQAAGDEEVEPNVCRFRRAAQLIRAMEVRDEIATAADIHARGRPDQLIDVVRRGYAGEWVGQAASDAIWLSEIAPIFGLPPESLRELADQLLRSKRLGLTGDIVMPWDERFQPRDDPADHLDDTRPPDGPLWFGRLDLHSETGTEGGYWAMQRDDVTGYAGLRLLRTGDWLEIIDEAGDVEWRGYVRLRHYPAFTESARGMWIHADQRGVDRDRWAGWFLGGRPARLIADESGTPRA